MDVEIDSVHSTYLGLAGRKHAAAAAEVAFQPTCRDERAVHIRAFGPLVTMQAARWRTANGIKPGSTVAHSASARPQRSRKRQPEGSLVRGGTMPGIVRSCSPRRPNSGCEATRPRA